MVKVFEVPVYAFSKDVLQKKVHEKVHKLREKNRRINPGIPDKNNNRITIREIEPMNEWKYNHIVGYIEIAMTASDVYFSVYYAWKNKKYLWTTHKKHFIHNIYANGTHFRILPDMDSAKIFSEILRWIKTIEKDHFRKSCYADTQAFESVGEYIDFKSLAESVGGSIMNE